MDIVKSGIPRSYLSTDGTMAANSDVKVPTEKAIVTYVAATALGAPIDATDIADGSVTDTEFQYIGTLASNAQTQISGISTAVSSAATINPGHHHVVSAIDTTGTADALIGTYTPAVAALTDGMEVILVSAFANATTTPTFQYNALTAKTIVKGAGTALVAGDIPEAGYSCHFRYRAATDKWILLNPRFPVFTDVTTGDASTTAHGYQMKVTTANQALGTGDSPTFVNVTGSGFLATGTQALKSGGATSQYLYSKIMYAQTAAFTLSGATTVSPALTIPAGAIVLGVGCKVTTAVTSGDGGTSFTIGDGSTADKWGALIPFTVNTMAGTAYYPAGAFALACYPAGGTVTITCTGGTFSGGQLRVIVWYFLIGA